MSVYREERAYRLGKLDGITAVLIYIESRGPDFDVEECYEFFIKERKRILKEKEDAAITDMSKCSQELAEGLTLFETED